MLKYITLCFVSLFFLSSCKENASDPGTPPTYTQPKVGSTFTYDYYKIDTRTSQIIVESRDTATVMVLQTGITFMGRSNVTMLQDKSRTYTDTIYISVESDGDLSLLGSPRIFGVQGVDQKTIGWVVIPTGSKQISRDTLIDSGGVKLRTLSTYVGEDTLLVNGQSINTLKMRVTTYLTIPSTAYASYVDFSIAPSIGFWGKRDQPGELIGPGTRGEASMSTLLDYNMK